MPNSSLAEATEACQPRLRGRYASRLAGAQVLAEITAVVAAAVAFVVIVFVYPDRLLWPSATHGTPQQWITAAAVALLLSLSAGRGRAAIYGNIALTVRMDGLSAVKQYQLAREGRRLSRQTAGVHVALAALLVAPLGPALVQAWQVNNPATVWVLGPQLLGRLAPAIGLHLLYLYLAVALEGVAEVLDTQQARRAALQTAPDPLVGAVGEDEGRLVGGILSSGE